MIGQKHLIECHCSLPLYKNSKDIVYHKFVVYSKFDQNNNIVPKYAKCNNCDATHYVYELCKSEVKPGKEDSNFILSKEDISINIPTKILNLLDKYECGIEIYEEVDDIIESKYFPHSIVISREIIDEEHQIKMINIVSEDKIKIETQKIKNIVRGNQWLLKWKKLQEKDNNQEI